MHIAIAPKAIRQRDRVKRPTGAHLPTYLATFYALSVKSVLRRHHLVVGDVPTIADRFQLVPQVQQEWFDLFGVPADAPAIPFTYFTPASTIALLRFLDHLQINFRYLLHVRSEMRFNAPGRTVEPDKVYPTVVELDDIIPLPKNRVALVFNSSIFDDGATIITQVKDFFSIQHLPIADVDALSALETYQQHDAGALQALSQRPPPLATAGVAYQAQALFFPENMGLRYGKVSGDRNIVHTTRLGARLFGYKQPFVQGLCTANYILKTLVCATRCMLQRFSIAFTRPISLGQQVELRYTGDAFEVGDQHGKILACGAWNHA